MRIQEYNQTDFGVVFDLKKANARNKAKLVTIGCEKKNQQHKEQQISEINLKRWEFEWQLILHDRVREGESHDPLIAQ